MLRPLRCTGIPSFAQRCATAIGWPSYFAILGHPVMTSGVAAGLLLDLVFLGIEGQVSSVPLVSGMKLATTPETRKAHAQT